MENKNWPDEIRLEMVEKSNFYQDPKIYQYGYYDGYQKKLSTENKQICEECDGTGEIERNIDGADVPTVCQYCNPNEIKQTMLNLIRIGIQFHNSPLKIVESLMEKFNITLK